MENKKIISLIFLSLILVITPAAFAWIIQPSNIPVQQRAGSIHSYELGRQSIVVAENEPDTAENGVQTNKESQDHAPASKTPESDKAGNTSDDSATKPLKSFKPSEEIAAEQAVDFPVDI